MKTLIIDRDSVTSNMMRSKLEQSGHDVRVESVKNDALGQIGAQNPEDGFSLVFLDPAPLANARPLILNLRRAAAQYPYIVLMRPSEDTMPEDEEEDGVPTLRTGANAGVMKPLDDLALQEHVENAVRLRALITLLGDDTLDFPSAGGVIAKSAFNQLFLSALERADRYGEETYIIVIGIHEYMNLRDESGPYAAEYSSAKLANTLSRIRRHSDIAGQIDRGEYALLLQRPQYDSEPFDAIKRLILDISGRADIQPDATHSVQVTLSLISLPDGKEHMSRTVTPGAEQ